MQLFDIREHATLNYVSSLSFLAIDLILVVVVVIKLTSASIQYILSPF